MTVLRIAIQKSGRLSDQSFNLLDRCGIECDSKRDRLLIPSRSFPIEFMLVRDDDIPDFVADGVCDLGIVGQNIVAEKTTGQLRELRQLAFGYCRLSIAMPDKAAGAGLSELANKRIATSYPQTLARYLKSQNIAASIVEITGSVEIAPALDMADAICDLVSSGATLKANGLTEVRSILESQAVLVSSPPLAQQNQQSEPEAQRKAALLAQLLQRLDGVLKAQQTKYVMMNAPRDRVDEIKAILPGMEDPTIVPLTAPDKVAIHAVAPEEIFWETMARLKELGASSILVAPIEKIID